MTFVTLAGEIGNVIMRVGARVRAGARVAPKVDPNPPLRARVALKVEPNPPRRAREAQRTDPNPLQRVRVRVDPRAIPSPIASHNSSGMERANSDPRIDLEDVRQTSMGSLASRRISSSVYDAVQ
mmetsp:Transcript_38970/g.72004  ORF Transcript_38970/g.72004 Transcript_38970/m.72004 type:complete len:125 (+) Transcript_38970:269-643(+)